MLYGLEMLCVTMFFSIGKKAQQVGLDVFILNQGNTGGSAKKLGDFDEREVLVVEFPD